jgi:2-keto-4-pentenoate hydratase/2-oxohepta-3-ene-1,7-dioic acid hydratase in catechol pathway
VRPITEVTLRAPVPHPTTVRDYMVFEQHVAGVAKLTGPGAIVPAQWYRAPAFYFTNPYAVIGPNDPVPAGTNISDTHGEAHIASYTIMIDWSARDLQFAEMEVRLGPVKAKDTATTLGPVLVTPDELESARAAKSFDLPMSASVNGTQIGHDTLASMAFSWGEMVASA